MLCACVLLLTKVARFSDFAGCEKALVHDQGFFLVRQAWRVARKRNQLGCGGHAGDLEVKVLYTPGKGKC